jgi:DNA-binding XRE family transcriptional regulator
MPEDVQSHYSWLRNTRTAAGFKTRASLARPVGVSTDSVSKWEGGKALPLWERVAAIADELKVPRSAAVEGIWKEKVGDPCPCGCGGEKVLPDPSQWPNDAFPVDFDVEQLRHARMLPIMLPCANCGKIRVHLHRRKRTHHHPLCRSCSRLAEKTPFKCIGFHLPYFDNRQKLHARRCRGTLSLIPAEVSKEQQKEQRRSNLSPESIDRARRGNDVFFDLASGQRRDWLCAKAAKVWTRRLKTLREAGHKKPITSMKQLNDAFRKHLRENPETTELRAGFSRSDQERGRQTYIERCKTKKETKTNWPEMTNGCMLRRWGKLCQTCKHNPHAGSPCAECAEQGCACATYVATELPSSVRLGICVWCWNRDAQGPLLITKDRTTEDGGVSKNRFHGPCYREWRSTTDEGRHFISRQQQGQEASLPPYKPGNRPGEVTLKTRWSWFWQHFAGGMTSSEIARQNGCAESTVREGIEYIAKILPGSHLLAEQFRPQIEAAKTLSRNSTANSQQFSANSPTKSFPLFSR